MKLHLAVELASLGPALTLAESVCDYVDSLWVSPILIKNEGLRAVEAFRTSFCQKPVIADMLSIEPAGLEADLAFAAGADMMTVLAIAGNDNIISAVRSAHRRSRRVLANLYGVEDAMLSAATLLNLGVAGLVVTLAQDGQSYGVGPEVLRKLTSLTVPVYVSGCSQTPGLEVARRCGVADVLVGKDIYSARDPLDAARQLYLAAGRL